MGNGGWYDFLVCNILVVLELGRGAIASIEKGGAIENRDRGIPSKGNMGEDADNVARWWVKLKNSEK